MRRLILFTSVLLFAACAPGSDSGTTPAPAAASSQPVASSQPAATPNLPNRTKVVRLIIVPDSVNPADVNAVAQLVAAEGAAKTDVFIVRDKAQGWHPRSLLNGQLVDHDVATRRDRQVTVFVMVSEREQIQWESSVPFTISSIAQKDSVPEQTLNNTSQKEAHPNPFGDGPLKASGAPGRPIRSGPPALRNLAGNEYDQLYKVSFVLIIDGQKVPIDPDVYCDWN